MPLDEAVAFVQEKAFECPPQERAARQALVREAMAGEPAAVRAAEEMVAQILEEHAVEVAGRSREEAAFEIYARLWGLGPVEAVYRDPEVDEVRVNGPDSVYVHRRGKNEPVPVKFADEAELEAVIKRMILHDEGASLDRSDPGVESVRRDGSRLTALCRPVARTWHFVLRKHGTFDMSVENLNRHGTLDARVWEALRVLVRGRANILFSGNVNSGKTSLMRKLLGELHPGLRVLVIGKDLELLLYRHYPDRDVIELEEHPEVGMTMRDLFIKGLRLSPDVFVVEEFRGPEEAIEAVRACTRGHPGSMATGHFNSPEEAVEGMGLLLIEGRLPLPLELAMLRVARSFNVVVQMFSDSVRGTKKLVSVTEIVVTPGGGIEFRDLIRWQPHGDDYLGPGEWRFEHPPSPGLRAKMFRFGVTDAVIEKAGWKLDGDAPDCGGVWRAGDGSGDIRRLGVAGRV